jgi:formylglycine-generating enzyme required for sulfatase activity
MCPLRRSLCLAACLFALALLALPPSGGAPAPRTGGQLTNSIGMKLVRIPAGKFKMGSPVDEVARKQDEGPVRTVHLTRPFFLGVTEVTQEQYQRVMGNNPSFFSATGGGRERVKGLQTGKLPVECVSWEDAVRFCRKLSALPREKGAGRVYRLPTEAEWEYACRAGTRTTFSVGAALSSRQANFNGGSPYGGAPLGANLARTTAVGSYRANAWGLFDMHGNVFELCGDWFDTAYYKVGPARDPQGPEKGTYRVVRGGSWANVGLNCRAADRNCVAVTARLNFVGFRVACVNPALR